SRADRSYRYPQGGGDLLVAQFRPGVEVEHLAVLLREPCEGTCEPRGLALGVEAALGLLAWLRERISAGASQGPQLAALPAPLSAHQVGGDPVEPGERLTEGRIVGGASPIGENEGLGREFLGRVGVESPAQVSVDVVEVAVEEHG